TMGWRQRRNDQPRVRRFSRKVLAWETRVPGDDQISCERWPVGFEPHITASGICFLQSSSGPNPDRQL
ncbi:MAG TPA: hypothetical protein VNX46_17330, partial [Candidatus Acidoferrum sp.]|nr:hypothetical protein [Candidatus Acidoferrum sp.]